MTELNTSKLPWYKNVFEKPVVKRLVQLSFYPYILQAGALICFVLFIYFGW